MQAELKYNHNDYRHVCGIMFYPMHTKEAARRNE